MNEMTGKREENMEAKHSGVYIRPLEDGRTMIPRKVLRGLKRLRDRKGRLAERLGVRGIRSQ